LFVKPHGRGREPPLRGKKKRGGGVQKRRWPKKMVGEERFARQKRVKLTKGEGNSWRMKNQKTHAWEEKEG